MNCSWIRIRDSKIERVNSLFMSIPCWIRYLSRLWCVFEIAAYRAANPEGEIELAPIFVELTVLVPWVMIFCSTCLSWLGWTATSGGPIPSPIGSTSMLTKASCFARCYANATDGKLFATSPRIQEGHLGLHPPLALLLCTFTEVRSLFHAEVLLGCNAICLGATVGGCTLPASPHLSKASVDWEHGQFWCRQGWVSGRVWSEVRHDGAFALGGDDWHCKLLGPGFRKKRCDQVLLTYTWLSQILHATNSSSRVSVMNSTKTLYN